MKIFLLTILMCLQILWTAAAANVPLMPVRDLRPGMQGIGKTVIQGDTIEEFDVEVVGVNGTEASGYSILVRLSGDIIEKTGGVAQGMSGSPVYIDGRLVGAVAYGRAFNDPHFCFLTPIGQMLTLLDEPRRLPKDWIPQGTALQAGGFTEEGLAYLQEKLSPLGLDAQGVGGTGEGSSKELVPGSAVGAGLMQGDLNLGAIGTVTWTDDAGHVLAFGHPFMQRGASGFFMHKAWVLGVIPNLQSSYKVGNIGEPIGTFSQDRASGIGGAIGALPDALPVYVTANDSSRGRSNSARVRIIEDEMLAPAIVDAVVVNTLSKTVDRSGRGTAKLHFVITGVDSKKENLVIDRENMYYAGDNILKNIDYELTDAVNILMQNKFEPVKLYGITVEAEVSDDVRVAEITDIGLRKRDFAPGEKVPISVKLKPYRGEEFTREVSFTVPKEYPGDKMVLSVRGGSSMSWIVELLRKQQSEGAPVAKKKKKQRTLQDYVKSVNTADKNNEIIVDIGGAAMEMPMTEEAAQNDAGLEGMLQGSPHKKHFAQDFIVDGEAEITLNITR